MPRYDQSFTGLCEQGLQDTLHLKQRYLDAKSKRVSKAKEKKQDNTSSSTGIQSSVHVQQKFLKRSVDDLDSSGASDNFGEPPVKLQCTNEGLTKFSVEIVQQLEFTTSAANSQPQQISTNVTVKTHANASVKSDVSSPKSNPTTPQNQQQGQQHQQKANIGLDIGLDVVKQEPDNDFADLDSCAAALEKDAAANGGAGFGASFPDLMGEDDNGDMSDAFKDLISDISNYHDYPELMKELDFEDKSDLGGLKMEDSKDHAHIPLNPDMKNPQNHMLGNQNNFSNQMFEKNGLPGRMPYSVPNMDFAKTELSPAAQTLKQMAEQHQHKNQMGLNFNPAHRTPNARSPYQDFQNFQGDFGSPNSNPNFKSSPNFPNPDMIKQEMIYQGDFNDVKRKAQATGGIYSNKQQYSPYGSPGQGGHGSPGFLPNRGAGGQPPPNGGQFGGAGTPPRPPSGPGGGPQNQGGTTLQINQAQQLNITQQSQGHAIQVSAGQHLHLSGDIKGNVSIATQQGMHFTHQHHQANPNSGQNQNQHNQQSSQGGNNQNNSGSQTNHMAGGNQGSMNQQSSQQMNPNLNQMHQQMTNQQMSNQQTNLGSMSNPNSSIPNMGNNQSMGPNSTMGGNPPMGGNSNHGNSASMPGALGSMMGGPNMPHGGMAHGDSYSMSQTQTINFTQQNLRRATGMNNPMGGPNSMGPGGPMTGPTGPMGPRLISAQSIEQQKLMQQQHMLRAQQAAMQQQQQQLRPPPPDYKASAGLGQGSMQPRFGAPAPPPNMRRMPHQPIPPSGPMIRSNMQYILQQQQQQMPVRQAMFRGQQGPMGMEMQQNSAEWRHMMMTQQQNVSFGGMRPGFQQGGFSINASNNPMQQQMSALQHQQHQLRSQQAMGNSQGGLGQMMAHNGSPMAQMNSMNQAMMHMQQQQSMMQQQNNQQMSMSSLHMQQSQSISVSNIQNSISSQNSGALLNESINSVVSSGASGQANNPGNNPLSGFNPGTDFNFEFLDNLPGTNDSTPFTDQELLNSFDADSGFTLDF